MSTVVVLVKGAPIEIIRSLAVHLVHSNLHGALNGPGVPVGEAVSTGESHIPTDYLCSTNVEIVITNRTFYL